MATREHCNLPIHHTRISPNITTPRKAAIKRLSPHCVAGNLTIDRTLGLPAFITASRPGVSVNYAIGTDGRLGLGCPESSAAWTTSSGYNDNRAITFEIANNTLGPNWGMSDAAINTWLDLAEDICKFYGYKKVNYQPKPDNISGKDAVEAWIKTWEKSDEMIITLHRWYSTKSCPGPYFVGILPRLVAELNARLSGKAPVKFPGVQTTTPTTPTTPTPSFTAYKIRITASALNIRKGPGTNNAIVRTLRNDNNIYTIVDEAAGKGAKKWGKLKSGEGWVSLDFTKKV